MMTHFQMIRTTRSNKLTKQNKLMWRMSWILRSTMYWKTTSKSRRRFTRTKSSWMTTSLTRGRTYRRTSFKSSLIQWPKTMFVIQIILSTSESLIMLLCRITCHRLYFHQKQIGVWRWISKISPLTKLTQSKACSICSAQFLQSTEVNPTTASPWRTSSIKEDITARDHRLDHRASVLAHACHTNRLKRQIRP